MDGHPEGEGGVNGVCLCVGSGGSSVGDLFLLVRGGGDGAVGVLDHLCTADHGDQQEETEEEEEEEGEAQVYVHLQPGEWAH